MKSPPKLRISYGDCSLQQHNTVEYIGCYLDSNFKGVSMARRVLKKINFKLNFWWRKSNYLNYSSRRLLCNALIQPHFDYGCTPWYPLLSKALKTELKIAQNNFRKINWLPVERRVELCTSTTVFKCWKRIVPSYLNDMFMSSLSKH